MLAFKQQENEKERRQSKERTKCKLKEGGRAGERQAGRRASERRVGERQACSQAGRRKAGRGAGGRDGMPEQLVAQTAVWTFLVLVMLQKIDKEGNSVSHLGCSRKITSHKSNNCIESSICLSFNQTGLHLKVLTHFQFP